MTKPRFADVKAVLRPALAVSLIAAIFTCIFTPRFVGVLAAVAIFCSGVCVLLGRITKKFRLADVNAVLTPVVLAMCFVVTFIALVSSVFPSANEFSPGAALIILVTAGCGVLHWRLRRRK